MATETYPVGSKVYYTPTRAIYPAYGVIFPAGVPIPAVVIRHSYSAVVYMTINHIVLLSGMNCTAYDYELSISKPEPEE